MSLYPRWFPYPRAWLKAIALYLAAYPASGVPVLAFWLFIIPFTLVLIALPLEPMAWMLFLGVVSLPFFGFGFFVIAVAIYRGFLALLWSNPPSLITPSLHPGDLWRNFLVSFWAMVPISVVLFIQIAAEAYLEAWYLVETGNKIELSIVRPGLAIDTLLQLSWTWLIVAAYLIHVQQLKRQNNKS
jgi:hypothetical protein